MENLYCFAGGSGGGGCGPQKRNTETAGSAKNLN